MYHSSTVELSNCIPRNTKRLVREISLTRRTTLQIIPLLVLATLEGSVETLLEGSVDTMPPAPLLVLPALSFPEGNADMTPQFPPDPRPRSRGLFLQAFADVPQVPLLQLQDASHESRQFDLP